MSLKYLDAEQRQHIVRLDGIDAPAKGQPFQTFRQQSDLSPFLSFDELLHAARNVALPHLGEPPPAIKAFSHRLGQEQPLLGKTPTRLPHCAQ